MEPKKSKETSAWEAQLIHEHPEKHGRRPRAAGVAPEDEETIPQAAPSHGITDRGKSNEKAHHYPGVPYHPNSKVGVKKQSGSVISKNSHPECYE